MTDREQEADDRRRADLLHRQQRNIAKRLLNLAMDFRTLRKHSKELAHGTRPDIRHAAAYADFHSDGLRWQSILFELAARVELSPWTAPVDVDSASDLPDTEPKPPAN